MPVVTSTYPSSQVWSKFDFKSIPQDFGSLDYRWPMFLQYQYNKWENFQHQQNLKKALKKWSFLVSDYD